MGPVKDMKRSWNSCQYCIGAAPAAPGCRATQSARSFLIMSLPSVYLRYSES